MVSQQQHQERAVALAGLMQACHLVTGIARTGMVSQDSLAGSLAAIFVTSPDSAFDVYADGSGARTGLRLCAEVLGDLKVSEYADDLRYLAAVLRLEKRLRRSPELLAAVGRGIDEAQVLMSTTQREPADASIVARLASVYEQTAGTLEPRIRVQGQQKHLQEETNTRRIRALLLSALRSAVLWRQLGGHLRQCILSRGSLIHAINTAEERLNLTAPTNDIN